MNYTVYHLHSDLSNGVTNIDSVTKYTEYVDLAASLGMTALAFSEHGSVFEWVKKKEYINSKGMKYIHAEEFYVTKTLEEKVRDNRHCILIAKNYDGVKELNKLSSIAFNKEDNHKYYVPRISIDELCATSDNIIVTSACLGGILRDEDSEFISQFLQFMITNKHRCFLEIQHHLVKDQIEYNKFLYKLHKEYDIPMVAGTDTHCLNSVHEDARKVLQKSKKIYFENEEGWDLSFKSYDELVAAYREQNSIPINDVLIAIENTNLIANMVEDFELDRSYKYPHLWNNPEELIMKKIQDGIISRGVNKYDNYNEYLERIDYEMHAYKHNGAIDFMLLMEDIISWCHNNDIPTGYGRGSVNGSVVAWLLGITEMDSIKHNLNFERFMNVERVSLSDIDTDFPPSRIDDVKSYVFNRHGLYCSDIITFNTIADKGAIRDVGRALDIDLKTVGELCDLVDSPEKLEKKKSQYEELFKYVDILKGTIVSIGNHPCGMIVCGEPLDDSIGLCTTSTDEFPISQIYMKEVDSLNYVKLDLLKLDTIELIDAVCKAANIPLILPDDVDIYDDKVWNSIRDNTTSIFQWEGDTGNEYIKKLLSDTNEASFKSVTNEVNKMTLLSIGNSAIRPAGASYREDLARGIIRKSGSKAIDDFLKPTFGYLVFQCQIIEFLNKYCGFTMGEADIVRRHFAKKTGTDKDIPIIKNGGYLTDDKSHYIKGFVKTMNEMYGLTEEEAEDTIVDFLQVIEDASAYLFSLNHSEPYSYMGFVCGWLRYYYPLEFITCCLNINKDKREKTVAVTEYAKSVGIKIMPIKFRQSISNYTFNKEENCIYKGIASIKFLNDSIANELYALRDNQYDTFIDLLRDIKETSVNSRQLDILIKLGFFEEFGEIGELLHINKVFCVINRIKNINKINISSMGISEDIIKRFAVAETKCLYKFDEESKDKLLKYICSNINVPPTTAYDKIRYQAEHLEYIDYVDPTVPKSIVYVTNLDTKYSIKFNAYNINTGKSCVLKVYKKYNKFNKEVKNYFNKTPFGNGDVLNISCKKQPKMVKNGDEWITLDGQYDWWIVDYSVVNSAT